MLVSVSFDVFRADSDEDFCSSTLRQDIINKPNPITLTAHDGEEEVQFMGYRYFCSHIKKFS